MLFTLAWRNIWRNYRRSVLVLLSVVIGLIAIILYDSLSIGMIQQMLDNQIGAHVSHIQVHKKGFNDNPVIQNYLPDPARVRQLLAQQKGVAHFSERVITFGIVSSATGASGVSMVGIYPQQEVQITKIKNSLVEGRYLGDAPHEIVIGRKLAEKLDVGLGDKVVAMASALSGAIGSDVFRVVGIYETFSSEFDKSHAYVYLPNLQQMLEFESQISEFAVILGNLERQNEVQAALVQELGSGYEVLTYKQLLPLLVMQVDVYKETIFIFYAIIGIAMMFGIINTMLMSVFERIHEFGVLMAVGMKNRRLFVMILLEAFLLGISGTVIGAVIGYLIYLPLADSGINLSAFADGLNSIGSGSVIYPILTPESIVSAIFVIPAIAVLGAIYPALRAARLDPITAIRHV
ncbi:MAG: ABC transporter permease [Calditrichae bacterium]|nr:ABC transporter permease [Calditrichia bacterium]